MTAKDWADQLVAALRKGPHAASSNRGYKIILGVLEDATTEAREDGFREAAAMMEETVSKIYRKVDEGK